MARAIDWTHYNQLKAQGLGDREIARQWEIPWSTFHREKQKREPISVTVPENQDQNTEVHSRTPASYQRHTQAHPSIPAQQPTRVHQSTPAKQPTVVHPSVPVLNDLAVRLLSLVPDLEVIVARERDRQRLWKRAAWGAVVVARPGAVIDRIALAALYCARAKWQGELSDSSCDNDLLSLSQVSPAILAVWQQEEAATQALKAARQEAKAARQAAA
jgi:hypothetical protein